MVLLDALALVDQVDQHQLAMLLSTITTKTTRAQIVWI